MDEVQAVQNLKIAGLCDAGLRETRVPRTKASRGLMQA